MSRIPDDIKSKYNKDSKFIWVDAQLEKFMDRQKGLESIKQQYKNAICDVLEMVKKYPNDFELGEKVRSYSYQFDTTNENQLTLFDD